MKPGQARPISATGYLQEAVNALAPVNINRLHGLLLDPLDQGLDAIAHVSGVQRGLVREIVIQGAYGNTGFQCHGPCSDALPAVTLPYPNKGIKNSLNGHLGARLRRAFQRPGLGRWFSRAHLQ